MTWEELPQELQDAVRSETLKRTGKLLARRAHSETELRAAMHGWGCCEEVADQAMSRLKELDLVDDLAFARQWVEERGCRKGLAVARVWGELMVKGVAPDIAQRAIEEAGLDDEGRAQEVAAGLLKKVARRPLGQQAVSLQQMLVRRGFELETAMAAVRKVLPPEGWD
jgi:regulatory protein